MSVNHEAPWAHFREALHLRVLQTQGWQLRGEPPECCTLGASAP